MKHARCLLQFNQYHKYTVDEHTLRAVSEAAEFADNATTRSAYAYREIADKRVLHLALLLHDLGKGFEEDHSEVGKRIAEETVRAVRSRRTHGRRRRVSGSQASGDVAPHVPPRHVRHSLARRLSLDKWARSNACGCCSC